MADPTKKHARVMALRCHEDVVERLCAGFPCSAVARFVRDRKGESRDIAQKTLEEELRQYRQQLRDDGEIVHPTLSLCHVRAEERFWGRLQELDRLERRFQALQYRFDVLHGEERMTGEINPKVDKIDKGMRETIMKMHEIKMDLGLTGTRNIVPMEVSPEQVERIRQRYGEPAAKAFKDPVSRARVLAALGAIKKAAEYERELAVLNGEEDETMEEHVPAAARSRRSPER